MSKALIIPCPVQNVPEYAENKRYIVATFWRGQLWFHSATDRPEVAAEIESEDDSRMAIDRGELKA